MNPARALKTMSTAKRNGTVTGMDAIVLAAGRGVRMGRDVPKQFLRLAGKPLLVHVLEVFEALEDVDRVWVTALAGYEDEYRRLFEQYRLEKPELVPGGETRQWSVARALESVRSPRVIVHEAVRPFVTADFVRGLLAWPDAAVVPTQPIPFTVAEGDAFMTAELNRARLHNVQLPQVFNTAVLREAHRRFREPGDATEDSLLVFRLGERVRFVPGREENIKITTPLDLQLAELIYRER